MPRSVYSLEHYRFSKTDKLFLDTNVWLCVYGDSRFRNPQVLDYKHAVKQINAVQCQVYVDSVVISEFIHVRIIEALKNSSGFPSLKAFRLSPAFIEAMEQIEVDVKKILARCHYIDNGSNSPQAIYELLSDCKVGRMDYNDHIIARVCATHGITLVTADADFAKFAKQKTTRQIRILTANLAALNPRK